MSSSNDKDFNSCFKQDILRLFMAFDENNFFTFDKFIELWNEMKFYQIFALSRFMPVEYREFMKDTLKIIVEFFYDDELDSEVRTAALYTLYAFYTQQTHKPFNKIPVTQEQWIKILQYIADMNEKGVQDIEYVFRYLLHSNAFEFCSDQEFESLYSLKNVSRASKKATKGQDKEAKNEQEDSVLKNEFNDELVEQMRTIHEAYFELREAVSSKANNKDQLPTYGISNFDELLEASKLIDEPTSVFKKLAKAHKTATPFDFLPESSKAKKTAPKKPSQKSTLRMSRNLESFFNRDDENESTTNDVPPSVSAIDDDEGKEEDVSTDDGGDDDDEDDDDDVDAQKLLEHLEMTKSSNELASKKNLF